MANTASQLRANILSVIAAKLPAAAQELEHLFELNKNDKRNCKSGYGVRYMGADPIGTVTNAYALSHNFEVILTGTAARENDDSDILTVLDDRYDVLDEIFKTCATTKAGLQSLVLLVADPRILEPERVGSEIVALRMQFAVRYRSNL